MSDPNSLVAQASYRVSVVASLPGGSSPSDRSTIEYMVRALLVNLESSNGTTIAVNENDDGTTDISTVFIGIGTGG